MKASRLLNLLLLLQTRQRITTSELAERLEVSRRTVLRDVESLSAAGVPVYAERGRNGGIVLLPGARLNASHLEPGELEALSVTGLDSSQLDRLGLSAAHQMARHKIAARQASAPGTSPDFPQLADLIAVDNTPWMVSNLTPGVNIAELALDLRSRRQLQIEYRRSAESRSTIRVVDPYGLATKSDRWYLVADDHGAGRLFALDRIEAYECLGEPAKTRAGQTLSTVWTELKKRIEASSQVIITVRLRENRLDLALRILGARIDDVATGESGWCLVRLRYPDLESVRQLLQFADHIEVLTPDKARERVQQLAADLAERHSSPRR
ncbi:helix-turn-helix transcriptional regulator [Arthrobacter rhizosphaerae]|uniref:helix-turn-helix transcriptional regulator n=1 Tax=Arthrobacter rhizosphaerae TaxID=2855490 RepID=UPI001FF3E28E|nr:YafY family protein [Arthrobacter rhizosphaerae]